MIQSYALTGGIACGKSMAERCFKACGCRVLDADQVVLALEAPGGAAVNPIVEAFGREVLAADGSIDRAALARVVFSNPAAREKLEAIIHPLVRNEVARWLKEAVSGDINIFSAALLFECGWEKEWQGVVCVAAMEATQMRRMMQVRKMSETDARARLAAQLPVEEKARRADWVIRNDSDDLNALQAQVTDLTTHWRNRFHTTNKNK